ncbi:Zinc finger protein MSN4 [Spathaspora sp. JA1]|nr:Zinc finger protein MSN4 [Spathaspora sp. JA1]
MSSDCPPIFENSSSTTFFNTNGGGVNTGNGSSAANDQTNNSFEATYYVDSQVDNLISPQHVNTNFNTVSYNAPGPVNTSTAVPESLHINDEIFFNNYQFTNQMGVNPNKLGTGNYEEESTSNISSSNSVNYISHNPSASSSSQSSFSSTSPSLGVHSNSATTTPTVNSMPQFGNGKHARQNSATIPIDQLTSLSLRTPSVSGQTQQQQLAPTPQQQQQLAGIAQPSFMFDPISGSASPNELDVLQSPTNFSYSQAAVAAVANFIPTIPEERTINPRQLFTRLNTSMSSPSLSTLFTTYTSQQQPQHHHQQHQSKPPPQQQTQSQLVSPQQSTPTTAALAAQISPTAPAVPSFMPQHTRSVSTPQFDFKVDDEFSQAISSWLNGGWVENLNPEIMNTNPIKKNSRIYNNIKGRRNSIQPQVQVIQQVPQQDPPQQQVQGVQMQVSQQIMDSMSYTSTPNTSPIVSSDDEDKTKKKSNKKRRKSVATIDPLATSPAISPTSTNDDKNASAFPCMECEKQFKRSEHLKRHIRSVHSNIRPFHCKYCEKKFSRSDNLAQHLKTHYRVDSEGNSHVITNPNGNRREKKKSQ